MSDGHGGRWRTWLTRGLVVLLAPIVGCASDDGWASAQRDGHARRAQLIGKSAPAVRSLPRRLSDGSFEMGPGPASRPAEHELRAPKPEAWTTLPPFKGIRAPSNSDLPLRIRTTAGPEIGVRRVGSKSSSARLEDELVVYENAVEGADAILYATESGVEELLEVRSADAVLSYSLELPESWSLRHTQKLPELVEVCDGRGTARLRFWARRAWDARGQDVALDIDVQGNAISINVAEDASWPVIVDPEWMGTQHMALPRSEHTSTLLLDGRVLVAGGETTGMCEIFDPRTGTFTLTNESLKHPRLAHGSVRLESGEVLLVGGGKGNHVGMTTTAELFDPVSGTFRLVGEMAVAQMYAAVTLLSSGNVLVSGGLNSGNTGLQEAEVYDVATETWTPVGPMTEARWYHTATLLGSGDVLLAGGMDAQATRLSSVEVFHPADGTFESAGTMEFARSEHAAVRLPSGRVLLLGGSSDMAVPLQSVEAFDPETGLCSPAALLPEGVTYPVATVLPSGRVLVIGGRGDVGQALTSSTLYDPELGAISVQDTRNPRLHHAATLLPGGQVLVTGGSTASISAEIFRQYHVSESHRTSLLGPRAYAKALTLSDGRVLVGDGTNLSVAGLLETFDPTRDVFETEGELVVQQASYAPVLLPSDIALLFGGRTADVESSAIEAFDPSRQKAEVLGLLPLGLFDHDATLLSPSSVLITGGRSADELARRNAYLYDVASAETHPTGSMAQERMVHQSTRLNDGRILVVGGISSQGEYLTSAEVYDPEEHTFAAVHNLHFGRVKHQVTRLKSGKVLVTGASTPTAELFDPDTGHFAIAGDLESIHWGGAATLLSSGEVLIAGGLNQGNQPVAVAEVFNPDAGTFRRVGDLGHARTEHALAPLKDGRALVVGGLDDPWDPTNSGLASVEIYDPSTESFSTLGSSNLVRPGHTATLLPSGEVLAVGGMSIGSTKADVVDTKTGNVTRTVQTKIRRTRHTATLLRNGNVLVTGGEDSGTPLNSAEIYDRQDDSFRLVDAMMSSARSQHAATLLPSGKVLITGGSDLAKAELFDPVAETFQEAGSLQAPRSSHAAVLLPSGDVLVVGGVDGKREPVVDAELFDHESGEFRSIEGTPPLRGKTHAVVEPSGDVLIVGGLSYRYRTASGQFESVVSYEGESVAVVPLLSGDTLACKAIAGYFGHCSIFGPESPEVTGIFLTPDDQANGTITPLADGSVLVRGMRLEGLSHSYRVSLLPTGVRRPVLTPDPAQSTITIGEEVTLRGVGFMRSGAADESAEALADIAPFVMFMPASGGGPIYSPALSYTDTRVTFTPTPTTFHGPGWLHVVVEGVPSEGTFVVLEPRALGGPCTQDGECINGFCTEEVCCSERCQEPCRSCIASRKKSGADGQCGDIPLDEDPKGGCPEDPIAECARAGGCDGEGACKRVAEWTSCATSRLCKEGECALTLGASCTNALECAEGQRCGVAHTCEVFRVEPRPVDPGACGLSRGPVRSDRTTWLVWSSLAGLGVLWLRSRRRG